MASASVMEDHITCAVCFEIYRDPHALKCLHTLCLVCIKQIQRGENIQCPECRDFTHINDVRKDFKSSGFVDLYQQQKTRSLQAKRTERKQSRQRSLRKSAGGGVTICETCKVPNRSIKSKCVECRQVMCESCAITHRGIPVCQNHQVIPMKDAVKATIASLNSTINDLGNDKKYIEEKSESISVKVDEIRNHHEKQIEEVNRLIDDMIKDLNDHRKNINHTIFAANNGFVEKLKRSKQTFDESKIEVQDNIDFLVELVSGEDMMALTESAKTVEGNIKYDMKKLKASLPNIDLLGSSPVVLERLVAKLSPDMVVKVKVGDEENNKEDISLPVLHAQFSQMVNFTYKFDKSLSLNFYPQRLCEIRSNIWIAGWDGIYVFNKYCKAIKTIKHPEIQMVRGLIKAHTGDALLACIGGKGLLRIDSDGVFKDRIANGSFTDVCTYKKKVYALDNEIGKIIVLEHRSNNGWVQVKEFNNLKNCERICVNCDALYISSRELHQMYVYNLDGQRMYHAGERGSRKPGKLKNPLLCDVNNSGDALVADCDNHRLQIHYQRNGTWRIFALPGDWRWPVDAVIDENANAVWMIKHEPSQLLKFSRKHASMCDLLDSIM